MRHRVLALLFCLITTACAGPSATIRASLPEGSTDTRRELRDTPFFPQEEYQCGPAALSTLLSASGIRIAPGELSGKVYLPERRGSLQLELVAATRRYDRLPYVLDPDFSALLAELLDGRPVMVLQNLGLRSFPIWHYAVVVGFDRDGEQLILRSGDRERHVTSTAKFLRSWELAGYWAMVVLRPDELPVSPDEDRYVAGVVALESVASPDACAGFYRTAVARWSDNTLARFGLGNMQYALGEQDAAQATYEQLLSVRPDHSAARHNLAYLLAEKGCFEEAIRELDAGLAAADEGSPVQRQLLETRRDIADRRQSGSAVTACRRLP